MENIILLRALELTYAKEASKFIDRMLGRSEGLILKDVTFHLYKGEVLGILSDYRTLHYLKEVVNGTLDLKKGKVKNASSMLSLDVLDHVDNPHPLEIFTRELLEEFMDVEGVQKAQERLLELPLFRKHQYTAMNNLTRRELALVLLEISKQANTDIVIYCNMYHHLHKQDKEVFKETINALEAAEKGVLLLESDIEPIQTLANYFLWLSYGQIRYDGSVREGVLEYSAYEKKKSQIKNMDEEAQFDIEWKRNIEDYGRYEHGFKRMSRNQSGLIDQFNVQKIIISVVLLFVMFMSSIIIFMDISFTDGRSATEEPAALPEAEESERFAYGINTDPDLKLEGESIPYMYLLEISSDREGDYRIVEDGLDVEVDASSILYFNPASLYPETTLVELLPYTADTFGGSYLFYKKFLNGGVSLLNDEVDTITEQTDRYARLGVPITYHIKDDVVFSVSFPAENIEKMYKEFGITEEDAIFRLPEGYMILDASNETWLYINR